MSVRVKGRIIRNLWNKEIYMFGGKLESVRIKKKICNINKVLKIG